MERLPVLDGLRAVAVLIVIISHADMGHIVPGGLGVTIFFFLSGYLITTLLRKEFEKNGFVNFRAFYLRRSVRIIPPMLICYLVATLLVVSGLVARPMNFGAIGWDLLFLTNYAPPLPSSHIPIPLWSLDIEEHFYLIFPAVFLLMMKKPLRWRMIALSLLILAALALRLFEFGRGNGDYVFYWTHTRYDAILFGVLLTIDQGTGRRWGHHGILLAAGIAIVAGTLVFRDEAFRETFRYSIQGVGLFLIFKALLEGRFPLLQAILGSAVLNRIAAWSYVLYLIHFSLLMAAHDTLTGIPAPARIVAGLATAFVFAAIMERYVEKPLLAWRKRIESGLQPRGPRRSKGLE